MNPPNPRDVWRLLNLPCEGMSRLSSESLDRDLGALERLALRSHLTYCAACRKYDRQVRRLRDALRALAFRLEHDPDFTPPGPPLPDDLRARLREAVADADPPA